MRPPVFWRRSATVAGVYSSAVLGFLGSVVAVRELGVFDFGLLSLVLAAGGFFQVFADVTAEEAVVKYGFRYAAQEDWGRFRQVFRVGLGLKLAGGVLGALAIVALAPFSHAVWGHRLVEPLLLSALLPLVQAPEGVASAGLIVRARHDVRAGFLALSMLLRLAALAIGGLFGVTQTVLALVVARALATAAVSGAAALQLRQLPQAPRMPLGKDRTDFRGFVVRSSLGSVLSPMRGLLGTLLLGVVTGPRDVAYFRLAQQPESAFASLTSPARLILLTEQTADVEQGREARAYGMLRGYVLAAAALLIVVLPPLAVFMPDLLRFVYGARAAPATDAARLFLAVAAIQVLLGWSKSFPISIGRPGLRLFAQAVEIAVLVPALLVLGAAYGATGAAGAFVIAAVAFALAWIALTVKLRRERRGHRMSAADSALP
jgi:O-antigen/teichoic acid export membrane protein